MEKGEYLGSILRSDKTVFSTKDVLLLWGESGSNAAKARLNYYARTGKLHRIRKGFYAKDSAYDPFELATKIFTPSYISLETVLGKAGITLQFYGSTTFIVSYLKRDVAIEDSWYKYRRIKNDILTNRMGIEMKKNYAIATPERAFLDVIYLYKDYHFDNLAPLDWNKIDAILPAYRGNRRMEKKVKEYRKLVTSG